MISTELARALRDSGLVWHPAAGDAFIIDRVEADDEVFILSDMTVEAHEFSTGTVLGFNGTTEWALDSVAIDDALWLPHERQLRERLGSTFRTLRAALGAAAAPSSTAPATPSSPAPASPSSTAPATPSSPAPASPSSAAPSVGASSGFSVEVVIEGATLVFDAEEAANAYARALLHLLDSLRADGDPFDA